MANSPGTPPKSYQQWASAIAPAWLQSPLAQTWLGGMGYVKDWLIARLKQGVLQRLPNFAVPDALAQIGIDRGIAKSSTDTNATYAARLINAWSTWQGAGSAQTLLQQLAVAGYNNVIIVQQNNFIFQLVSGSLVITPIYSYNSGPSNDVVPLQRPQWLFDLGQPATVAGQAQPQPVITTGPAPADQVGQPQNRRWARYSVIFPQPLPSTWTNVQQTLTTSTAPSITEINSIRSLIAQWGPGIAQCQGITAVTAGQVFGWPQMTWQSSATWGTLWNSSSVTWTPVVGSAT